MAAEAFAAMTAIFGMDYFTSLLGDDFGDDPTRLVKVRKTDPISSGPRGPQHLPPVPPAGSSPQASPGSFDDFEVGEEEDVQNRQRPPEFKGERGPRYTPPPTPPRPVRPTPEFKEQGPATPTPAPRPAPRPAPTPAPTPAMASPAGSSPMASPAGSAPAGSSPMASPIINIPEEEKKSSSIAMEQIRQLENTIRVTRQAIDALPEALRPTQLAGLRDKIRIAEKSIKGIRMLMRIGPQTAKTETPESTDPSSEVVEREEKGPATLGDRPSSPMGGVGLNIEPKKLRRSEARGFENISLVQQAHANYLQDLGKWNTSFSRSNLSFPSAGEGLVQASMKAALMDRGFKDV